jgi:hypothetical protein
VTFACGRCPAKPIRPFRGDGRAWTDILRAEYGDCHTARLRQLIAELLRDRDAEVPEDLDPDTYATVRTTVRQRSAGTPRSARVMSTTRPGQRIPKPRPYPSHMAAPHVTLRIRPIHMIILRGRRTHSRPADRSGWA